MKKIKTLVVALFVAVAAAGMAFADSVNLITDGTFEGAAASAWVAEGSSISLKEGKGVKDSTALYVIGKYSWSGAGKDLTKVMDLNSDYYMEIWFKAYEKDNQTRKANCSVCLQPEGVDNPDNYVYMMLDDDGGKYTGSESVPFTNAGYTKVCGVVRGEEMKSELAGKKCINITAYFKTDNPTRPFYIDNVVLRKIN